MNIKNKLKASGYKCNADGRREIYQEFGARKPRRISEEKIALLEAAEKVGGCRPGERYMYTDAQGQISEARVADLYNLPENMVNPVLVVFSGMMTAHLCAFEVLRTYARKTGRLLPLYAIGKGGNKGLYETVFNRQTGIMVGTEYNTYLNLLERLAPRTYVRANERICKDTSTDGNFDELYAMAKESGKAEVTFILCSGNFSYDKRLLAEFMLKAREAKYADAKMNFVVAHAPIITKLKVVDGRLSEILLGYVAAAIGPLMKDTITFDGKTSSARPERYLMPGVAEADWSIFEELICEFSNMGWPNYAELLYGRSHEDAVYDIIMADLRARGSFTAESYERELEEDLAEYASFLGGAYNGGEDIDAFVSYLQNTPEGHYF